MALTFTETVRAIMHSPPFIIISGLLPTIFASITIASCYHLAVTTHHHFPSWLWAPVISLLGCLEPERLIYQIGFTITALSTLLFRVTFANGLISVLPYHGFSKSISTLKHTIIICAVGVLGQGLITLSPDLVFILVEENDIDHFVPDTQSIIHQLAALLFFGGGLVHGIVSVRLYWNLRNAETMKPLWISRWFKMTLLAICLSRIVLSAVDHPVSTNNVGKTHETLNAAGIAQWTVVFTYLAFFSSYSVDYYVIIRERKRRESMLFDAVVMEDEVEAFLGKPQFDAVL